MHPSAPLPPRANQVRVGLRLGGTESVDQVGDIVRGVAGAGWQTLRLATDSGDLVAVGPSRHPVGTDAYADDAFAWARALRRTGLFSRVEADVPVPWRGQDPQVAPDALSCSPDSARTDWAREAIRWREALDLMAPEVRGGVGVSVGHPDSGYTKHPNVGAPFDLQRDWDVIDDDDDAKDDLVPNPHWPLPKPSSTHERRAARSSP